mmetsp:Transcript_4600/g.11264  ORF Transcript_4600/g.11264 Transcript_4600/m.11264 type:complete len:290 (-) Transcript_4600:103-972(-)
MFREASVFERQVVHRGGGLVPFVVRGGVVHRSRTSRPRHQTCPSADSGGSEGGFRRRRNQVVLCQKGCRKYYAGRRGRGGTALPYSVQADVQRRAGNRFRLDSGVLVSLSAGGRTSTSCARGFRECPGFEEEDWRELHERAPRQVLFRTDEVAFPRQLSPEARKVEVLEECIVLEMLQEEFLAPPPLQLFTLRNHGLAAETVRRFVQLQRVRGHHAELLPRFPSLLVCVDPPARVEPSNNRATTAQRLFPLFPDYEVAPRHAARPKVGARADGAAAARHRGRGAVQHRR